MIDELTKKLIEDSRSVLEGKKLDPVGKRDADVDNDGDVDDSDEYLGKRRDAIAKAMKKEGNKFTEKLMAAKKNGDKTFEVGGETYHVKEIEDMEHDPKKKDIKELDKEKEDEDEKKDVKEFFDLSELNAAGPEVLFALHSLLDRHKKLELPNGEVIELRNDSYIFGTMNPTSLRDYAGTQTLNKAFADRWVIWDKPFPNKEQLESIFKKRYPKLQNEFTDLIIKLAIEINNSFLSDDISINIETPMSLRTVVERIPVGLDLYKNASDPLHETWKNMVLPHVNPEDLDHYSTLWNTVVRNGPNIKPSL